MLLHLSGGNTIKKHIFICIEDTPFTVLAISFHKCDCVTYSGL